MSDDGRRTKTRHRGVYFREGATGRRYQITFLDSSGRRRWKTVGSSEKEAVAEFEDLRGRMRRGERVLPSKLTLAEVITLYFEQARNLRETTRERYEVGLRLWVLPSLGHRRITSITEDDVAHVVTDMLAAGKAGATCVATLTPLNRVFAFAVRRGLCSRNPVLGLSRDECPVAARRDLVVLTREEIGALLGAAVPPYRAVLASAVFTGLRFGELLGLRWRDVDFGAGVVRVRSQLGQGGELSVPKTAAARRDVVLMPALESVLQEHRLLAPPEYSGPDDWVFCSATGSPLDQHNVAARGLRPALAAAGITRHVTMHVLRHTFASLLIAQGADPVFLSRHLGHTNPGFTLQRYAHLFDSVRHADGMREMLEAEFGNSLATTPGDQGAHGGGEADAAHLRDFGV